MEAMGGIGGSACWQTAPHARPSKQTQTDSKWRINEHGMKSARSMAVPPAVRSILPNSSRFVAKIRQLTSTLYKGGGWIS